MARYIPHPLGGIPEFLVPLTTDEVFLLGDAIREKGRVVTDMRDWRARANQIEAVVFAEEPEGWRP